MTKYELSELHVMLVVFGMPGVGVARGVRGAREIHDERACFGFRACCISHGSMVNCSLVRDLRLIPLLPLNPV